MATSCSTYSAATNTSVDDVGAVPGGLTGAASMLARPVLTAIAPSTSGSAALTLISPPRSRPALVSLLTDAFITAFMRLCSEPVIDSRGDGFVHTCTLLQL